MSDEGFGFWGALPISLIATRFFFCEEIVEIALSTPPTFFRFRFTAATGCSKPLQRFVCGTLDLGEGVYVVVEPPARDVTCGRCRARVMVKFFFLGERRRGGGALESSSLPRKAFP